MTGTQTVRRTTTRARRGGSMQLLRGLGAAMLTTIIVVAVFALLMQWVKPTEDTVRIFNQLGEVEFKVNISTLMRPGNVEILHGWEQANSCLLIDRVFDPISGFPTFKDALCEIEKI